MRFGRRTLSGSGKFSQLVHCSGRDSLDSGNGHTLGSFLRCSARPSLMFWPAIVSADMLRRWFSPFSRWCRGGSNRNENHSEFGDRRTNPLVAILASVGRRRPFPLKVFAGRPSGTGSRRAIASMGYLQSARLSCEAMICQVPPRFSHVSVQIWHTFASGWDLSLPTACSLP